MPNPSGPVAHHRPSWVRGELGEIGANLADWALDGALLLFGGFDEGALDGLYSFSVGKEMCFVQYAPVHVCDLHMCACLSACVMYKFCAL